MSAPCLANQGYQSPWMTEELEILRSAVRKFLQSEFVPNEKKWQKQGFIDRDAWLKASEMGIALADIPEEYGGIGGHFGHEAVIFEELGYAGVMGFGKHVHNIAAHYILNYGSEAQRREWLPKMVRGELIGAIAMSEPGAGSDLLGVKTRAVRKSDRYVINGNKTFISNGYNADVLVLVTKTDPSQGARGTSLIIVETRDLPGYRIGRILEKIGQKSQDTCELFFADVEVPAENLLGGVEGQGFYQLMQDLPYERTILGVYAVAIIERALELTAGYTKERRAFGRMLFEFQNTRFKLAEAKAVAAVGRTFIDHCIQRLIEGTLDTITASIAKYWLTEQQCRVIDECLQLFGGYGYMLDYPIAQMYIDARAQMIYAGTNEIMKEIISRSL